LMSGMVFVLDIAERHVERLLACASGLTYPMMHWLSPPRGKILRRCGLRGRSAR